MNERMRNEILRRHLGGASLRAIARDFRIARKTVRRMLNQQEQDRTEGPRHPELPRPRQRRASSLDGAIILKIKGKSYRAHRAQQPTKTQNPAET